MTMFVKDGEIQLLGVISGTEYHYLIVGELTEEEILAMADSVQPEEEG